MSTPIPTNTLARDPHAVPTVPPKPTAAAAPVSAAFSRRDAIKAAFAKAEGTAALAAAIECGRLLVEAFEIVKSEGGKWLEYLGTVGIPQTTDSLYRRFAKHEPLIRNAKGIRDAREIVQDVARTEREAGGAKVVTVTTADGASPSGTTPDPIAVQEVLLKNRAKSATAVTAKLKSVGRVREKLITELKALDAVTAKPVITDMIDRLKSLLPTA